MIDKIKIENLTVFENLEIDTSAPINVFIGKNGTGKTQILKFIDMTFQLNFSVTQTLASGNGISTALFLDLIRDKESYSKIDLASCQLLFEGKPLCYRITPVPYAAHTWELDLSKTQDQLTTYNRMIFIPAKDMLTHSKGLPEMKKEYGSNMPFDETYINIIEKARKWNKKEIPTIAKNILPVLEDIMEGIVEISNDVFYIKKHNGPLIPFDHEAEGIKKIGLIWQLLMNGTITEGTILLWDEPESNLNPKLASVIADMLLELSRNGVQIFLSTHSYFLAKYFDILEKEEKEVVFHSLYQIGDNKDNPVICETSDTFSMLNQNSILGEIVELFEREMGWE